MKIAIIGMGYVGSSVYKDLSIYPSSVEISCYDKKFKESESEFYERIKDFDVCFICVNTPTLSSGSQSLHHISDVLLKLLDSKFSGIKVIKSTVTPKNAIQLERDFERLVFCPEFLTQSHSLNEKSFPLILGGESILDLLLVGRLFGENQRQHFVKGKDACFIKYMHNVLGAAKVTLFSHFFEKATSNFNNYNYYKALDILKEIGHEDSNYSQPYKDGKLGYGGDCFVKDTLAWNAENPSDLIEGLIRENERLRNL